MTLPRRMLDGVFYEMTPILAISWPVVLVNLLLAWVILLLQQRPPAPPS